MLQNWVESGFETVADVKAADEEFYKNNKAAEPKVNKTKPSKFDNYEDANKGDYAELEEQILDMMLDDNY